MSKHADPIGRAIETFLKVKNLVDQLDKQRENKKDKGVGSKLRARAREIPEMMLDLGLVPTLSYCFAKAGTGNISRVIRAVNSGKPDNLLEAKDKSETKDKKDKDEDEKLSYALYTYVLLSYLSIVAGRVGNVELKMEELAGRSDSEFTDILLRYIDALMKSDVKTVVQRLLQQYMLEFKRLCEAVYESERG